MLDNLPNWFDDLGARGAVFSSSDPELSRKLKSSDAFYVGIDPTAPYLQLGNLIALITVARLAQGGLAPILLFGGATGSIGDPSGKSAERKLLSLDELNENMASQERGAKMFLERLGAKPQFVNNASWTDPVSIVDFLRDVGKYFTVNYMIAKESVKARLESDGISFTEFSYMLLQAFDFYHLYQKFGCKLQIGGSDQWGNMTAGLELIRKKAGGEAYALCWPLLTDSAGKKFGKSEGGAIWLDKQGTSPYRLHQFLLNVSDDDAIRFTRLLSMKPMTQLAEIEIAFKAAPHTRLLQHELADSLCTLIHDQSATDEVKRAASVLFKGGELAEISDDVLREALAEVPQCSLAKEEFLNLSIIDLFVKAGAAPSKSEGKRLVASGGVYLHGERIADGGVLLKDTQHGVRELLVLRTGKKSYYLVNVGK